MGWVVTKNDNKLLILPGVHAQLIAHAQGAAPDECCGILLGKSAKITAAIPARNVHINPETHFEIDPQILIDAHRAQRAGGPDIIGYYHSHPNGLAEPSQTDRASAAGDGKVWAIIADSEITFWRDDRAGFEALSYSIAAA